MSVSTDDMILENQQIHEENQEVVTDNNEVPESNTPENNQETGFDFEKSKAELEYISILFALVGVISTGLIKILSLGRYLHFFYDINNCELKLTNTDFIILILSIFFCGLAILYCFMTNKLRIRISFKVTECLESHTKRIMKIIKVFMWGLLYIAVIFFYLIAGSFIISFIANNFKVFITLKNELAALLGYTFTFVISLSFFTLKDGKKLRIFYIIISVIVFILVGLSFFNLCYNSAANQKEFEIITVGSEEKKQEYAVISKGNSYSAYQCSTDENNILIIDTDHHRYFPLDDTETELRTFNGNKPE